MSPSTPSRRACRPTARRPAALVVVTGLLLAGCSFFGVADRQADTVAETETPAPPAARDAARQAATGPGDYPPPAGPTARAEDVSASGHYLAGLVATKRRDFNAATDFLVRALSKSPNNPTLLRQTFTLLVTQGRMDQAVALARRMSEIGVSHRVAPVLRALAAFRNGRYDQAQAELDSLPAQGLGALLDPLLSSWLDLAATGNAARVDSLDGLRRIEGISVLRHLHTALIQDVVGDAEAAANAYARLDSPAQALSLRLAWLVGNHHARQDRPEATRALYDRYLDSHPESTVMQALRDRLDDRTAPPAPVLATPREGMAEALFNVAGLLNQQGVQDLGLIYTRMALYLRPDYPIAQVLAGEILEHEGRPAEAIAAYEAVPADSPFHYSARLRTAGALQALGQDARAIRRLTQIAEAYPDRYEPLYRLGNIHRDAERFTAAAEVYAKAESRLADRAARHWTLFYFHGIALERTDRWAEAEARFKSALELKPRQPYVMNYLAYSWVEQEINLDKAQDMLKQAVEKRPEDGYIVDSMGWVYYRLGDYDKAVTYLERAVELRPGDPVINDHLGDAYWKVGRRQEARFQWHRALGMNPEPEVVERIESKLENGLETVSGRTPLRGANG